MQPPQPRRLLPAVLLLILTIGVVAPNVHAQTTKFLRLSYPRQVEYASPQPVVVELAVSYQDAEAGYLLVVGILDDEKQDYLKGTATGSPDPCLVSPAVTANTSCIVQLQAASGEEHVSFRFSAAENPHALGTWRLLAESGLQYPDGQVIFTSFFRHGFSVVVLHAVTIVTSSQISKTEAAAPLGENASLIFAATVAVALAAIGLFLLARRLGRRPKDVT